MKKSFEIGRVEGIPKKNAFDCYLFKNANVINDPNNILKVKVKVSKNGVDIFKKSISIKNILKYVRIRKIVITNAKV